MTLPPGEAEALRNATKVLAGEVRQLTAAAVYLKEQVEQTQDALIVLASLVASVTDGEPVVEEPKPNG